MSPANTCRTSLRERRARRTLPVTSEGRHCRDRGGDEQEGTMRRLPRGALALAAGVTIGLFAISDVAAQQREIIVGGMCDRTGPTQINGIAICPGIQDYYELVNSKGGVEGYRIKYIEIDHEYKVPQGVEAYQTEKREGAVSIMVYGTPQVQALNQVLTEDKIPGTAPGHRRPAEARKIRASDLCRAAARRRNGRASARHRATLPTRLRDCPSVRPVALAGDQRIQTRRLSAFESDGSGLGLV